MTGFDPEPRSQATCLSQCSSTAVCSPFPKPASRGLAGSAHSTVQLGRTVTFRRLSFPFNLGSFKGCFKDFKAPVSRIDLKMPPKLILCGVTLLWGCFHFPLLGKPNPSKFPSHYDSPDDCSAHTPVWRMEEDDVTSSL